VVSVATGRLDYPIAPMTLGNMRAYVDDDLIKTFRILYREPASHDATHKLISDLLPLANGQFWRPKEAMQN
jgi:hypothetical protein